MPCAFRNGAGRKLTEIELRRFHCSTADCYERWTQIFIAVAHGEVQFRFEVPGCRVESFEIEESMIQQVRRHYVAGRVEH